MSSSLLFVIVESALRSLLLAAVVGAGLAVLRARNVVGQKAAWTLVLCAAFFMPLVARLAARASLIPQNRTIAIPSRLWHTDPKPTPTAPVPAPVAAPATSTYSRPTPVIDSSTAPEPVSSPATQRSVAAPDRFPAPTISKYSVSQAPETAQPAAPIPLIHIPSRPAIALFCWLAICAALLLRLALGVSAAFRLWRNAIPVALEPAQNPAGLRLRSSRGLSSPVTIGSGVILPAGYADWDPEKLCIVLAHEASHVRQKDFYLQLAASLHAAIFWFSPLGWWLKRKLSDLSETISDRAAVSEAASHVSYAQVLLQFAAAPRPIQFGVAMANHRRLAPRIERLLNESSFRQAFSGGRARIAAAILLVPIALFAATALVRVQAASQQAQPAQPPDTLSGTAASSDVQAVPAPQAPTAPSSPSLPAAPPADGTSVVAPAAPDSPSEPPAPPSPDDRSVFTVGPKGNIIVIPRIAALKGKLDSQMAILSAQSSAMRAQMLADMAAHKGQFIALKGPAFAYGKGFGYGVGVGFGDDGNSYALVTGSGETNVHYSGEWFDGSGRKAEIEKARKVAHGDFLWFERDGKSYVVDDQSLLAPIKLMQQSMDNLGKQQEDLGRQQEELGKQQEALGRQQEQASVPTPDVSQELAKLNEAIAKLNAKKGGTVTQEELAEIQEKLGNLQGKIGDIEGKIGEKQGEFGEKQGELGEKQGVLGEQQGKLGSEQGRIARKMDGQVLTIIDESLKNGKARPVE